MRPPPHYWHFLLHQPSENTREAAEADATFASVRAIANDPVLSTEDQQDKKKSSFLVQVDDNTQDIDQYLQSFARELAQGGRDTRQQRKKRRRGQNKKDRNPQTVAPTFQPTPETVAGDGSNFPNQPLTIPDGLLTCLLEALPVRGTASQRKLVKKTPGRRRNKQNNDERALWKNEGLEDENESDNVPDSSSFDDLWDEDWESFSRRRMQGQNQFGWDGVAVRSTDPRQYIH